MCLKHLLSTCLFVLYSICSLQAQILNVEKVRLSSDSANYFLGSAGVAFNANNRSINDDGETVSFVGLTANADFGYISELHSFLLVSQFNYTATSDDPINSTGYGHFRINFLRNRQLSYETFAQVQYDQGRGMENRWLTGGGLRFRLNKTEKNSVYIGVGAMYEQEIWNYPGPSEILLTTRIWKSSNYISGRFQLNDHINLNLITYYQTGYDFDADYFRHRISGDLNLLINVTSKLSLTTTVFGMYENRPIVPISKVVYSVTNGIIVSF